MIQNLILVTIAAIAPTISAVALPKATTVADSLNARQTAPAPTDAPAFVRRDLQQRDYTRWGPTCGYYEDGDKEKAIACNDGFFCEFWPALPALSSASLDVSFNAWNCVPNPESVSFSVNPYDWKPATKCKDYDDNDNTKTYALTQDGILSCGSNEKKCNTYIFATVPPEAIPLPASSSIAAAQYTGFGCDTDAGTYTVSPTP